MPKNIRIASTELTSSGLLQVNVVNVQNNFPSAMPGSAFPIPANPPPH